jgi:hypothetical protein
VLSADYNRYMDIQQAINLRIHQVFTERAIEFAYPTQMLYLSRVAKKDAGDAQRSGDATSSPGTVAS